MSPQFTQSEDNVAQLVEEYGVQLQCKASMASELVELRDELAAAEEREAVLQQQLTEVLVDLGEGATMDAQPAHTTPCANTPLCIPPITVGGAAAGGPSAT